MVGCGAYYIAQRPERLAVARLFARLRISSSAMALKLRVISDHYKALGKRSSRLFGVTGGRIGRAQDNDWILPDPDRYVSSHHCKVDFRAGQWVLEDTSTNGVFINGSDTPASIEGAYALQDGDRLRLGDYEILVSIDERNDFPSGRERPDAAPRARARITRARPRAVGRGPRRRTGHHRSARASRLDPGGRSPPPSRAGDPTPFDLTQGARTRPCSRASPTPPPQPAARREAAAQRVRLAARQPPTKATRTVAHGSKPTTGRCRRGRTTARRWQALTSRRTGGERSDKPEPAAAPARRDRTIRRQHSSRRRRRSVLPRRRHRSFAPARGRAERPADAGRPDDARSRARADGALKGRADLKSRLRLSQTTIQPGENNPLKFSASVDEAVLKLLDPHGSRYLGPIEAIRESFADLRTHQTALVAAIQAGDRRTDEPHRARRTAGTLRSRPEARRAARRRRTR